MLLFWYCKCPTVGQLIYFSCYFKKSNAVILILQVSHRGTVNLYFLNLKTSNAVIPILQVSHRGTVNFFPAIPKHQMLLFWYCKCHTVGHLIYFSCYFRTSNAVILILQVSHRWTVNLYFLNLKTSNAVIPVSYTHLCSRGCAASACRSIFLFPVSL